MKFKKINNEEELKELMTETNDFHDGVINSVKYRSGSTGYCGGTCPFDSLARADVLIDGICGGNDVVLRFDKVKRINIVPIKEDYSTNIFDALLIIKNGLFIFSPFCDVKDEMDNNSTYIISEKLSYIIKKSKKTR